MNISIKVNTAAYDAFLANAEAKLPLSANGPNYTGTLEASDIYHQSQRDRFASASDEDGTWVELAPATVAEHARVGDTPPHILHLTGELEASLSRSDPNHVFEVTQNSIIEGTADPKARFHQDGGVNLAQRTVYVPPESDTLDNMRAAMVKGVADSLKP